MATRLASSGVMSTLASPATPSGRNSDRAPRVSHTSEVLTTAPASTVFAGYTLTAEVSTACSPMKHSSPTTTPSSQRTPARRSAERPITVPRSRAPLPR
jgi:hypothetical protein